MRNTNDLDAETGQEIVEEMTPEARAEAERELAQTEPAGSEPFRVGDEGPHTELDDDPIDESGSSRRSSL